MSHHRNKSVRDNVIDKKWAYSDSEGNTLHRVWAIAEDEGGYKKWTVSFLGCCSVGQLYLTLCNPVDCSRPGLPVPHHLLEFAQTHVRGVSDTIQPSHPLSSPSPPAFNLSQHQGLFQWVSPSHQVAKVLELQLQHQSFQWIFRVDFL